MTRVIIVGGGAIGLFCAVRLARAGTRVTVLEAEGEFPNVFGPGASAAAAGMLAPLEDEASSPHERIALDSFDLWRSLQSGAEWADGVRFDGAVVVRRDAAALAAFAAKAARLGRAAAPLSPGQFRKRTGLAAKVEHALFTEAEGTLDPLRVLSGLAMQARAHGVIIEYFADVAGVFANEVRLQDDRVYEADAIVLAPGAWATDPMQAAVPALRRVRAGKGHLVAVELERSLAPNLRAGDFYLAQRREDVVLGSTLEFDRYGRNVDPAQVAKLAAAVEALLPGEVKLTDRAWAGIRPMSPDGWPMIGPAREGLFVAAGHSRNGWLLAPITAEIITAYVIGAEIPDAWAALSPERFET